MFSFWLNILRYLTILVTGDKFFKNATVWTQIWEMYWLYAHGNIVVYIPAYRPEKIFQTVRLESHHETINVRTVAKVITVFLR